MKSSVKSDMNNRRSQEKAGESKMSEVMTIIESKTGGIKMRMEKV